MPVWAPPLIGFRNWMGYTPTIPKLYWDVYSEEERVKKICMALHKIEEYLNYQTDTINKILEHYDDYEERISALETWRTLVDRHLAEIDTTLAELAEEDAELHKLIDELDNALTAYKAEVSRKFAEEHAWNVQQHASIDEAWRKSDAAINDAWRHGDADLRRDLQAQIADISFDTLLTLDPTTGELTPVAEVFQNLYDTLRYYAITAAQFDALSAMTAGAFDATLLTAQQFDLYGYTLLTGGVIGEPVIPTWQVDELQGAIEDLENGQAELRGDVTELGSSVTALDGAVSEELAEIQASVSGVKDEVETLFSNDNVLATGVGNAVQQTVSIMMTAAGWSGNVYSFENLYPYADGYTCIVTKDSSMTQAQMDAFDTAQMVGSSAANTVTALGDVPTIDLLVNVLVVRHDVPSVSERS